MRQFLEAGSKVFATARHPESDALQSLKAVHGDELQLLTLDVTNSSEIETAVTSLAGHPVNLLINNAGLGGETPLVDMADEEWHRVIDVTLTGTMRCTRAVLRHMEPRAAGVIVNNASVLGWRAQTGQARYAAAKAGDMAMARCVALEVAEAGIRVNCVAPSLAIHPHLAKTSSDELIETLVAREAFGRAAEPWEVANVIVFLASDYSSYMTGEVVSVSSQQP